ncbi:unnamed protein product [Microthlaspi erraticum]|uniref:SKP1-like protein n=1 Tax=Microthlaspi erraticum TaxID=1685480 RepID=A0A6D2K5V2_9BRAS|nr:unnamed protein product [Microthlaspi erraticum]
MSTLAKKIFLRSSDGMIFQVEETVALQSQTIADMVKDDSVSHQIRIPNVTGDILEMVIKYCKKHVVASSSSSEEKLKKWDTDFVSKMDRSTLVRMINAAYYLNIKDLFDLTCKNVADRIMACRTVEEIHDFLGA